MKKWIVYRHTSPSGKVYVGITSQKAQTRWQYCNGYKVCSIFHKAIKKYGWSNFTHEILLDGISKEHAIYTEKYLISWYKLHNISYNITDGGEGSLGRKHSEDTKQKISKAHIGKVVSESTRLKQSMIRKGTKVGQLNPMYNKKHTNESKLKMSESRSGLLNHRYGKKLNDLEIQKCREAQTTCKIVLQIDITTEEVVMEYSSIREAAKYVGVYPTHISEACRGIRKTVKQYKWRYKNGSTIC